MQMKNAAVEADIQALKDILAKSTPESMTDAQVEEIKAGKEKLMASAQQLFNKGCTNRQAQQLEHSRQDQHRKQDRHQKDLTVTMW